MDILKINKFAHIFTLSTANPPPGGADGNLLTNYADDGEPEKPKGVKDALEYLLSEEEPEDEMWSETPEVEALCHSNCCALMTNGDTYELDRRPGHDPTKWVREITDEPASPEVVEAIEKAIAQKKQRAED